MSDGSTPASAIAARPDSTARSRSDLSCWILWGVLPIPRTPTRIDASLVRFGLAAAGPTVVRSTGRSPRPAIWPAAPDAGGSAGDLDVLGDRLARRRSRAPAGGRRARRRRGRAPGRAPTEAAPRLPISPTKLVPSSCSAATPGLAEAAQGLGVGLAGADRRVGRGAALGGPLQAAERLRGRRRRRRRRAPRAGSGPRARCPGARRRRPRGPRAPRPRGGRSRPRRPPRRPRRRRPRACRTTRSSWLTRWSVATTSAGGPPPAASAPASAKASRSAPGVAADVERDRLGQAERAGQRRRQLAQPEGRGLADGDHRAGARRRPRGAATAAS